VALIGTGASGVQVIPRPTESSGHFDVVQRTPAAQSNVL
jgi:cation diffusion facilitator CzcD-associated flavoprotein CzcO